jgi:hypothetical protein
VRRRTARPSTYEHDGLCLKDAGAGSSAPNGPGSLASGAIGSPARDAGAESQSEERKLEDGESCDGDEDCASEHCDNGHCCRSGVCCETKHDCPSEYASRAKCSDPTTCQGTRREAICDNKTCSTAMVDDDSACAESTIALKCDGRPVYCTGRTDQAEPLACAIGSTTTGAGVAGMSAAFAGMSGSSDMATGTAGTSGATPGMGESSDNTSCSGDRDCDPSSYCLSGQCIPDAQNGESCSRAAMCSSGNCAGGLCCSFGQCCRDNSDCRTSRKICVSRSTCTGAQIAQECRNNMCQDGAPVTETSACDGMEALKCGRYRAVVCQGGSASPCPATCANKSDCAIGNNCVTGVCLKACSVDDECDRSNHEMCVGASNGPGMGVCVDL